MGAVCLVLINDYPHPVPLPGLGEGTHTAIFRYCKRQSGLHQVKEKIANQQYGTHD